MKMTTGFVYALVAGIFAALASIFAKFAFNQSKLEKVACKDTTLMDILSKSLPISCYQVSLWMRAMALVMVFVVNALMFRSFSKALALCQSSVEATVSNTAANFCCSALFGWLFFNEKLSVLWCIGTSLILLGLSVIYKCQDRKNEHEIQKKVS